MSYLTETEVAERLRCSNAKVKRLRLSGRLPFIKGRPVLIDEVDLLTFIASMKEGAIAQPAAPGSYQVEVPARGGASPSETGAARAQRLWQLRKLRAQYEKR